MVKDDRHRTPGGSVDIFGISPDSPPFGAKNQDGVRVKLPDLATFKPVVEPLKKP